MNKADRLYQITNPDGPEFPLDDDIIEDLEDYPGEMPTDLDHWARLLTPHGAEPDVD